MHLADKNSNYKMSLLKNVDVLPDGIYQVFSDWSKNHSSILTGDFNDLTLIQPPTNWMMIF
jgi:hypothetical protein